MTSPSSGGRLEVAVLDRSWEVQSITWNNLTWWDPLPCGQELLASIKTSDPLPQPSSPASSLLGHPPTPRRRLPPTHLSFRSMSASPSPIPPRSSPRYSFEGFSSYSSSPLAWPLPPSPDSYNSVFIHSSDGSSPSYPHPYTPSSVSPQYICSSPFAIPQQVAVYPTPPESNGGQKFPIAMKSTSHTQFSFYQQPSPQVLFTPLPLTDGVRNFPPYLAQFPPPSYFHE